MATTVGRETKTMFQVVYRDGDSDTWKLWVIVLYQEMASNIASWVKGNLGVETAVVEVPYA